MKSFFSTLLLLTINLFFITAVYSQQNLESTLHNWKALEVVTKKTGERRQVLDGPTTFFDHLEIHVTTLDPGKAPHKSHTHEDIEELILVKEGKLKMTIGSEERILGAGSVGVAIPGDEHGVTNVGDTRATYYIIKWRLRDRSAIVKSNDRKSIMVDWNDVEFRETKKGGKRQILRHPTSMFEEFEMHVTTLNEGMTSHAQHTHIEEEIILVIKGEVEELIDGKAYRGGPGSLIYLDSNVPHGIKNVGKGQCEYFAFKWFSKK